MRELIERLEALVEANDSEIVRVQVRNRKDYLKNQGRVDNFRMKHGVKSFKEIEDVFGMILELGGSQKAVDGFISEMKKFFGDSFVYKIK